MENSAIFLILAYLAIAVQSFLLFLFFFEPYLPYKIQGPPSPPASDKFLTLLEFLTGSDAYPKTKIKVLTNADVYYEAELEAISKAQSSINLEAYIFQKGRVTKRFLDLLTERAKAGVKVNLVLDAIGCLATTEAYVEPLRKAGGRVEWYHPFKWYTLPRFNNRTHREIIVVDGRIGFLGGSGFADHWLYGKGKNLPWRDSMFRMEGEAVRALQTVFAENWLEASGEILTDPLYFPELKETDGTATVLITGSAPSAGRSTRARVLYQTLLAGARSSIYITSPYFLPDRHARGELIRAIRERGVEVKIIVPGKKSDHLLTRRSSRRIYGELLQAGAEIHEYQPAMIHAKILIVDGEWGIVGSTNFDHRSFGLNDEVNLVAQDADFAERLRRDFLADLSRSKSISLEQWQRRPFFERFHEWFGWILERQQ